MVEARKRSLEITLKGLILDIETGARKKVWWVKVLATSPDALASIPVITRWEKRFLQVIFYIQMNNAPSYTHTINKNK